MGGKRHLRKDKCKRCGGCEARMVLCRHGHRGCICHAVWVPLVRVPEMFVDGIRLRSNVDINEQRDYAEEAYNRAAMEREGLEELRHEQEAANYCTEELPIWVSGLSYVNDADVRTLYQAFRMTGSSRQIMCERCDKPYHPDYSADVYA